MYRNNHKACLIHVIHDGMCILDCNLSYTNSLIVTVLNSRKVGLIKYWTLKRMSLYRRRPSNNNSITRSHQQYH